MPVKSWNPGDVLAAADLDAWAVPVVAIKATPQTVTGSTALVNDSALVIPVAANAFYHVTALIEYNATTGGDFKWTWTVPAGASGFYGASYTSQGAAIYTGGGAGAWTDTNQANGQGTGTPMNVRFHGVLVTAGTIGNLQFRFAQFAASGTTTTMANSVIIAQMIG
jgi:hypothetical protein